MTPVDPPLPEELATCVTGFSQLFRRHSASGAGGHGSPRRGKGTKAQRLLSPQLGCYSSQRPPRSALAVSLLPSGQARKRAEESEGLNCKA